MAETTAPNLQIDLSASSVLIVDDNERYLEMLFQILTGFGIKTIHACKAAGEARSVVETTRLNLILVDMVLGPEDGCDWVRWLRRSEIEGNVHAPVIMVSAHSAARQVAKPRDCGANFMVAKPLVPAVLLERLLWVARSSRKFVESGNYVGPDRRFKVVQLPQGVTDRRRGAAPPEIKTSAASMSQAEIDALFQPQRVTL